MWCTDQSIDSLQVRIAHIQDKLDNLSKNINQTQAISVAADVLAECLADSRISSEEATIAINSLATADMSIDTRAIDTCTYAKSLEDIIAEYKEQIRLQPMSCVNCNGAIDRDTMICKYCGTPYRI